MTLITEKITIGGTLANVAGKQMVVDLTPVNHNWLLTRSDLHDVRFTDKDGNPLNFFRFQGVNDGNYVIAQYQVDMPTDGSGYFLKLYGDNAATDLSNSETTFKLPNIADADALHVWQTTESGSTFANSGTGSALTLLGNASHRNLSDMGWAMVPIRIAVMGAGISWTGTCGFDSNTTGYARTTTNFNAPASGAIGTWVFVGGLGTILEWKTDANNYLRLELLSGNLLHVLKVSAGVTTTDMTTVNAITGYGNTWLFGINYGTSYGLEVLLSGAPIMRNAADTSGWGTGANARLNIGARDDGTNIMQSSIFCTAFVHARPLTYGEWGHRCMHMRIPSNLSTQADKLTYYGVAIDGLATGEDGSAQEWSVSEDRNSDGVYDAFWHARFLNPCTVFHGTTSDRLQITRDTAHNPILGFGAGGEASGTFAVNTISIGQTNLVGYVHGFNTASAFTVASTIDGHTMTAPTAILSPRTSGTWPLGFGNIHIVKNGTGWLAFCEGITSNGTFEVGCARGTSLSNLSLDSDSARSACLTYGFGNTAPEVQTGGPFAWPGYDGCFHLWMHGYTGLFISGSYSIIFCRRTYDGIHFYSGPNDIVLGVQNQVISTAEQVGDAHVHDARGAGPMRFWCEVLDNGLGLSKIIVFTYEGNIQQFVTDSNYLITDRPLDYNPDPETSASVTVDGLTVSYTKTPAGLTAAIT